MRKRVSGKKFSRGSGSRRALKRSLIASLVEHGSIKTTKPRAKFIIPDIDRLINVAKNNDLNSKRKVYSEVGNQRKVADRIGEIAKAFSDQKSGFVKMTSLGTRKGDQAEIVRLEWTRNPTPAVTATPRLKRSKRTNEKPNSKKKTSQKSTVSKSSKEKNTKK